MNSKKDLDKLIEEALLNEIATMIANDSEQNRSLSPVAAKHVETLQRSNEQLVKIIGLCQKNQNQSPDLSDDDKNSLFDMIQETTENG